MSSPVEFKLVLAGHGSRSQVGYDEFEAFVTLFQAEYPSVDFRHGYLEFNQPTIEEAVASFAEEQSAPIVVVPAILAAATHVKNDMPIILDQLKQRFPDKDIRFANVLDLHEKLLRLCRDRICEAEARASGTVTREQTCLVVVGRGTTDPDANGNIAKLARMLHEGMGFGASTVCYSGTSFPLVAEGLKQAARLGFKRLLVLPYFLFDGILVQRIYSAADALQRRHPDIEVVKAGYLGVDKTTAAVVMERAEEAVAGKAVMNCQTCKYRVPVVGYEREVGQPRRSHRTQSNCLEYVMHPIEAQSFEIIRAGTDWSRVPEEIRCVAERLVHTTGDFSVIDDLFVSSGAVQAGIDALLRCKMIITDVTMVSSGLRRSILSDLNIDVWCGVHDAATAVMATTHGITRSAAGIRRAWMEFGNDVVVAIGDAPTAVAEAVRLVREHGWRPQLIIGLPVGFVGTAESKELLKNCIQVPRITNCGNKGGSPWAAAAMNALLIEANNKIARSVNAKV